MYTHLEGNFPGGTVDLTNRFGLRDGLIARLEIVPPRCRVVSVSHAGLQLGRIGAWFNPLYDDDTCTVFVVQACGPEPLKHLLPGLTGINR